MSTDDAFQILMRAADARGQLLRCEADRPGPNATQLLLTFDVGRILVEPFVGGLSVRSLEDPNEGPSNLRVLDEEEPWWRLLGNPLTAVLPMTDGSGFGLRFREEDANPRVVRLVSQATAIGVSLEDSSDG